jgi:hypothetical protein
MLTAPAPSSGLHTADHIADAAHSVNFMVVSRASYSICVERKLEEDTADEIRRHSTEHYICRSGVHA